MMPFLFNLTGKYCSNPTFIIVGAMKCGTSSLFSYLSSHPQVVPASKKEIHYFDNQYYRSNNWYLAHFPLQKRLELTGAITGEASPYYLYHPHCAKRIFDFNPHTRIIILLRNPVDRAISHYWHEVRAEREKLPMEEAFEAESGRIDEEKERLQHETSYYSHTHQHFSYLDRGRYAPQVEKYINYFNQSNVLVLNSNMLFNSAQHTFDCTTDFLQIERHTLSDVRPRHTGSYDHPTSPALRARLDQFFAPYNRQLYELLDLEVPWW